MLSLQGFIVLVSVCFVDYLLSLFFSWLLPAQRLVNPRLNLSRSFIIFTLGVRCFVESPAPSSLVVPFPCSPALLFPLSSLVSPSLLHALTH